jgi:uncharacterized membrane protein
MYAFNKRFRQTKFKGSSPEFWVGLIICLVMFGIGLLNAKNEGGMFVAPIFWFLSIAGGFFAYHAKKKEKIHRIYFSLKIGSIDVKSKEYL